MPTETNFEALESGIVSAIKAKFPDYPVVEFDRKERSPLTGPSILLSMTAMEPAEKQPGTEQIAVIANFEAHIILGFRTDSVKRQIRYSAAALAHLIHLNRWGQGIKPATVTDIASDDFNPELDQYEVWRVDWFQEIYVGDSIWAGGGIVPSEVLASWEPETGIPNEDKYKDISEATA